MPLLKLLCQSCRARETVLSSLRHLRSARFLQNQNVITEGESDVQNEIQTESTTTVPAPRFKTFAKIPTNVPFVKNLFLGVFDKEMLAYPDFPNNEELVTLNNFVQILEKVFKEKVDSSKIDKDGKIPGDVWKTLASFGLFGLQIPVEYGGFGVTSSKYARLAEVVAQDSSLALTLSAHQAFTAMAIMRHGSDDQKAFYLPSLASGDRAIGAFCLTESTCGSDIASIESRATLSGDRCTYSLNGRKAWVISGATADVLITFAKTEITDDKGVISDKITAFIVERKFGGVTSSPVTRRFGARGADICDVTFDNTPVPACNVLGSPGQGFKIAVDILNYGRYHIGSAGPGLMKRLIGNYISHITSTKRFGTNLYNYKLVKAKLARLAVRTYAMESVAFLTSQNIDVYENPDMSVEAAIVKIFNSETTWDCLNEVMQIYGVSALTEDQPFERHLRDARVSLTCEGNNDILRLYVALTCLKHAGLDLKRIVYERRNMLDFPGTHFKSLWKKMRSKDEFPSLTLELSGEVHPNLKTAADGLEINVLRLKNVVEEMLTRYGNDIVGEQLVLKRFADVAILLYAMTASIARSSRSIQIGLINHDDEILMTLIFCKEASAKVYRLLVELIAGPTRNDDDNLVIIADKLIKRQTYTPYHPMSRNW